jgi:hypothetical protein
MVWHKYDFSIEDINENGKRPLILGEPCETIEPKK